MEKHLLPTNPSFYTNTYDDGELNMPSVPRSNHESFSLIDKDEFPDIPITDEETKKNTCE